MKKVSEKTAWLELWSYLSFKCWKINLCIANDCFYASNPPASL